MLFPTVAFALFFSVAFLANWLLRPHHTAWRLAITGLSLFFYGYWDPRFVALLVGSVVVNTVVGRLVVLHRRRWILAFGVTLNLAVLGVFKYYGFFASSIDNGLSRLGVDVAPPLLDLTLPIGISFFTFQAISYLVDGHRGLFERPMPLLDVAVFLTFFPQLVAGPIVRASDMAPQISHRPDPRTIPAGEAFWLIGQGLVKKVVISSYVATTVVDPVFDVPGEASTLDVVVASYGYAIQIYADFSGYTDIAIGVALLLGFRFPVNFDAPYRSTSLREFWHRWHISLSTWLRDYLYIPLGGGRRGRLRTVGNLAIVMLVGGLWHGAAWTFVLWGAIHGAALAIERAVAPLLRRLPLPAPVMAAGGWLITFHVVTVSWVFFRAESISTALELLARLAPAGAAVGQVSAVALAVIGGALAVQFVPDGVAERARRDFGRLSPALQIACCALALTTIDALGPDGVAPFIYFQF